MEEHFSPQCRLQQHSQYRHYLEFVLDKPHRLWHSLLRLTAVDSNNHGIMSHAYLKICLVLSYYIFRSWLVLAVHHIHV